MKTERNIICAAFIIIGFFILCGNEESQKLSEITERLIVSFIFFINAAFIWAANKSNKEVK